MKQVISKDDVAQAISELKAQGKKPTLAGLHAALGSRGSMTTLVRMRSEVLESQPSTESQEALTTFRQMWARAVGEGRREQEELIFDLRESLAALTAECDRLHGTSIAAQNRATEWEAKALEAGLEHQRVQVGFQDELCRLREELDAARQQATAALKRITEIQTACQSELQASRAELDLARHKAHEFELSLARASALLEANGMILAGSTERAQSYGGQSKSNQNGREASMEQAPA